MIALGISDSIQEVKKATVNLSEVYPGLARCVYEYCSVCEHVVQILLRSEVSEDLMMPALERTGEGIIKINEALLKIQKSEFGFGLPKLKYTNALEVTLPKATKALQEEIVNLHEIDTVEVLSRTSRFLIEASNFNRIADRFISGKQVSVAVEFLDMFEESNTSRFRTIELPSNVNIDKLDQCVLELEKLGRYVDLESSRGKYALILDNLDSKASKIISKYLGVKVRR